MGREDFERGYQLGAAFADAQEQARRDAMALPAPPADLQAILDLPEPSDELLGVYRGYFERVCGVPEIAQRPAGGDRDAEERGER